MKKRRYQNVVLTIPSGTTSGQLIEQPLNLDPAYNKIIGVQANVILATTLNNNLLLGARTDRTTAAVDLIPQAAWNANNQAGVPPMEKFLSLGEDGGGLGYGSGDIFYAQAKPLASPGADVVIYFTLWLEADIVEVPR